MGWAMGWNRSPAEFAVCICQKSENLSDFLKENVVRHDFNVLKLKYPIKIEQGYILVTNKKKFY